MWEEGEHHSLVFFFWVDGNGVGWGRVGQGGGERGSITCYFLETNERWFKMEACASLVGKSLESSSLGVSRNICAYNESHFFFKILYCWCCMLPDAKKVSSAMFDIKLCWFFCLFFALFLFVCSFAFYPLLLTDNWWPSISLCNMVVVSRRKVSLERFLLQGKGENKQIQCNIGVRDRLEAC